MEVDRVDSMEIGAKKLRCTKRKLPKKLSGTRKVGAKSRRMEDPPRGQLKINTFFSQLVANPLGIEWKGEGGSGTILKQTLDRQGCPFNSDHSKQ